MGEENEKLTDEEIQKSVNEIRKWLEKELPDAQRDDRKILNFLQGCKYRIETAKTKLKNDYLFRKNTPEWFSNRDPEREDIKDALACGLAIFPDNFRDDKGRRIQFVRPNFHDASLSGDVYYQIVNMCLDDVMEDDPLVAENGIIAVIDFDKTTLMHCWKKTMVTRKMIHWWMSCLPLRIKELHVINLPPFAIYFFNISKSLLKEKMRKRFVVHRKIDGLKKYIDPKFLPHEYGGTAGPFGDILKDYLKRMSERREFFMNEEY